MEEVKECVSSSISLNNPIIEENSKLKEEIESLKRQLSEIKSTISQQTLAPSSTHVLDFPTDLPSKTSSFPMVSIGNGGVPTDRQIDISPTLEAISSLKTELKIKFRNLTKQEFRVFSAIYILEQQQQQVDYRILAEKLRLSEGSIRDYTMKIERKGIPLSKEKVNNKKVLLHVRTELKELLPLEAIMNFREPIFK